MSSLGKRLIRAAKEAREIAKAGSPLFELEALTRGNWMKVSEWETWEEACEAYRERAKTIGAAMDMRVRCPQGF